MLIYTFLFSYTYLALSYAKVVFYTYTYPPFSDCSRYIPGSNSSVAFGAEVEFIRSSFALINWTEGRDYSFDCSPFDYQVLEIEADPDRENLFGIIGGLTMTSERVKDNFTFCQPTVSLPLRFVYRQVSGGWFFTRGLDTITWVVLFLTMFLIGGLLYLLEDRKTAYVNMLYNVLGQFFLVRDYPLSRFTSKFVDYLSTFLVVITVIIFTAVSTNIFQADRDFGNSLRLDKMTNNQVIYANDIFFKYLDQFGLSHASADGYDYNDFVHQIDKIGVDFLLVDAPYSDFLVRQHCEFYTSPHEIDLIHYAIMFQKKFPRHLTNLISQGISLAKKIKDFEYYIADYYNQRSDLKACSDKVQYEDQKVALFEMKSLWYIFFCSIGIAAGFLIMDRLGIVMKKNLNIYDLNGVRAKMDRKIQRRVSTLFAINASLSMQSTVCFRKMSQIALDIPLEALRKVLPPSLLLFLHLRENRKSQIKLSERSNKRSPLQWIRRSLKTQREKSLTTARSPTVQRVANRRLMSTMEFRKNSSNSNSPILSPRKRNNTQINPLPITMELASMRRNAVEGDMRDLKRRESRKSSLLAQSNQAFQLDNKFQLKLESLMETSSRNTQRIPDSEENSLRNSQRTANETKSEIKRYHKFATMIEKEAKTFLGRVLGRKGLKKSPQINMIASNLITEKEASLDLELSMKKSQVLSRTSTLNLYHLRRATTFQVSENMSPVSQRSQKSRFADSPESPIRTSMFRHTLSPGFDSRDSHRVLEINSKNSSETVLFKTYPIKRQHWYKEDEDYSFEMKTEAFREEKEDFVSYNLKARNFSEFIGSTSRRNINVHRIVNREQIQEVKEDKR